MSVIIGIWATVIIVAVAAAIVLAAVVFYKAMKMFVE